MPLLHALILGVVQGLSEFLPISSSGHLILVRWFFGWTSLDDPSVAKAFDVALHIGTLVAVVAYFRRDVVTYVRAGLRVVVERRRARTLDERIAWLLVLTTIPASIAGALFEGFIDEVLGAPVVIAVSLIVFGLVLGWADRSTGTRTIEHFRIRDALLIGAAQTLALNPGTSRSGITITAARRCGFGRDAAARISFLMSLPITAGAIVYKMTGLVRDGDYEGLVAPMAMGILAAGLSGWVAVWGTLRLVRTRSFTPFVVYRVVLGVAVLAVLALGWR